MKALNHDCGITGLKIISPRMLAGVWRGSARTARMIYSAQGMKQEFHHQFWWEMLPAVPRDKNSYAYRRLKRTWFDHTCSNHPFLSVDYENHLTATYSKTLPCFSPATGCRPFLLPLVSRHPLIGFQNAIGVTKFLMRKQTRWLMSRCMRVATLAITRFWLRRRSKVVRLRRQMRILIAISNWKDSANSKTGILSI